MPPLTSRTGLRDRITNWPISAASERYSRAVKKIASTAIAALTLTTAGTLIAAPANAAQWVPPGSDIRYFWSSDSPTNTISYRLAGDEPLTIKRQQFDPTLINIGNAGPRYHLSMRFKTSRWLKASISMQSDGSSAQCQVILNGTNYIENAYNPNTKRAIVYC